MNFPPSAPPPPTNSIRGASLRASACPGLLRIAQALDGGICRVKLPCGQLTTTQAAAIAVASERYASGVIEITNRANLQIRGIQTSSADALIATLLEAGLGAVTAGGDDVRNVMVSPSAGIDDMALIDTTSTASAILSLLQTQTRFHQLSPKFALSIDGGEALAMLEHSHDLWLSASLADDDKRGVQFIFGLAGNPAHGDALGRVPADQTTALVEAVLHTFLDLATPEQSRMRQLLQIISPNEFLRQVQQRLPFSLNTKLGSWARPLAQMHAHIGVHAQRDASLRYIGAVPPLGRIDAVQLRGLAQLVHQFGDDTIRLTPWQSVLLPNIPHASAEIVIGKLIQQGFSTSVDEPIAHLIACTGSRGCAKGFADTKADALQLSHQLQKKSLHPVVHFSGCSRSCAAAFVAPFTLLAVADGHYDLFQRDERIDGFGKKLASSIDLFQAMEFFESASPAVNPSPSVNNSPLQNESPLEKP